VAAIVLDNLTRRYPRQPVPVIQHVSLEVQQGELVALLGPSGSGKSTILKLIAGLDMPDAGDIRFNGQTVLDTPANRRGAVLMFQKAYLFPFLNVADNIGFGLKVQGARRQTIKAEVARMLDIVGLPGKEHRYPSQLSGGEQQRVALARALVTNPRVIMLDEPLSSLDTAVRHNLQEVIRRIQRDMGMTTLLVTHDLGEAVAMSDRTALLLGGTIAACDRPDALFQRPPTRQTAKFVGVSTFLEGQFEQSHLHTHLGSLKVSPSETSPRKALFAIRPEHMRLLNTPEPNTLPGTIVDAIYKGEFTEYQVSVGHDMVRVKAYQPHQRNGHGNQVHVQFPPEHLFEVRE
jgi:ABC-type Fe3+/spermidine/putrescine transport system ATPase subunit